MWWVVVIVLFAGCDRVFGLNPVTTQDTSVRCCAPSPLCPRIVDSNSCVALGCEWTSAAACGGTHASCDSYQLQSGCELHDGCAWDADGPCTGDHLPCGKLDGTTCGGHGCIFEPEACGGPHHACGFYSGNMNLCEGHGCTYTVNTGTCGGTPHACSSLAGSLCMLEGLDGCTYTKEACTGTPHACSSEVSSTSCTAGGCASWDTADCNGATEECNSHGDAPSCEIHDGCTWSADGSCVAPSDCSTLDEDACTDGCSLQDCP